MSLANDFLPPRYRDVVPLGHGGMGDIYRAEDALLGRPVVVKVLAERYAQDEGVRRRFMREARAAARLSGQPNVITIFDVGESNDRPYIVMELLTGGSLADRLAAEGAQAPERALAWLDDAAAALDAAHARHVVHRDVKPANLLLDDHDRVHVADFGIASAAGLDSFTAAGTVLGTAGYLSPEGARGERAIPASDVYALAVVAFELLTGRRPFENATPTAEAAAHINAPIPSPRAFNPTLPPAVDAVFARGLAKEPAARYATAGAFASALRAAVRGERVPTAAAAAPTAVVHRPALRRTPALAALVALALAGIALGALAFAGDDEAPPREAAGRTVLQTVTAEGTATTVVETVVTTVPAAQEETKEEEEEEKTEEEEPSQPTGGDPAALNDRGYELMQAGRYDEALPLLEESVAGLSGSGELAEAYASYNLAYTRRKLGRCDGVLELLDRSEAVQGRRAEIDGLRKEARKAC